MRSLSDVEAIAGCLFMAEELTDAIVDAPVAMVDTRPGLALCALREEDFPRLEALRGRKVGLVDYESLTRILHGIKIMEESDQAPMEESDQAGI